ncbi:ATP-binding protein [Falsibacillus pallidus]|uniref:histidine kinase n=1 Tax=Falsibacillus pallidus TaxID=493781 RepID=A0A370G5L1_9BACI|nr:ATP-binding protein [Falsibacillus pallidus]RDI38500.1 two-component system sporulation sensor kinase B [Falsibacillus pallidus]
MKEFNHIANIVLYRWTAALIIAIMVLGVVTSPSLSWNAGIIIQSFFVVVISVLLIIYPKKESILLRSILIFTIAGYFYAFFIYYPLTALNFIFIALLPAVAIGFFHKKLFYTIWILNFAGAFGAFLYVYFEEGEKFSFLKGDFTGNVLDFIGAQIMLYFIFFITNNRIDRISQYYDHIQKSERLKMTGQLAAAVAHEIRNPIAVVKGFLQLYREDPNIPESAKEHFQLMLLEMDQAESVIQDFLSLSKPHDEHASLVDLSEILKSVTDLLQSYGSINNIQFKVDQAEESFIYGSKVELKQLLVNIMKNSIEAMKKGGEIRISSRTEGDYAVVEIADEGVGMDQEEIKELGTPFYSLKSSGTGLGLMICYNILEKYGGSLQFKSEKGAGTTAILTFKKA